MINQPMRLSCRNYKQGGILAGALQRGNMELEIELQVKKYAKELFSEIAQEIANQDITDIEWDGYCLWIKDLKRGSYYSPKKLSNQYVENLSIRLSNIMNRHINRFDPVLEANTKDLRISVWHESIAGKKSVAIRKIPLYLRFSHESLLEEQYCSAQILNLLENCVIAHFNSIIGGQPNAGKTELLKYLSTFIPGNEKVGTYEDNKEIHYREINPGKKCVEVQVNHKFHYADAIKAGLRHNIEWVLLSESRGPEVVDLLNTLSTGGYCMTTIHLEQVKELPDRMYNMLGECNITERFINSIYKYIDMAVIVECDKNMKRRIKELGFFYRENQENHCHILYADGEFSKIRIPQAIMQKFIKYGICNPLNSIYEQNSVFDYSKQAVER